MKKSRTRAQRRALNGLLENGIISSAIGGVLLFAPTILKGSPVINAVAAALHPVGWIALGLGLAMVAIHALLQRRKMEESREPEAPVSRFQHSELPEELLNPPRRVRQEPPFRPQTGAATAAPRLAAQTWSPQVFAQIEWRRFEGVCEALFAQAGFRTRAQSHGADGGVDVWLHSRHAQGPVAVVQCKHWLGKPVGVKEMREFFGVMSANKLTRGTYATSGRYTADAIEFAKGNGINTLDGTCLLKLIHQRTPEQQKALLAVAYDGEYWRPTCASCGIKLVERTPSKGGASFWGCINYPRCRAMLAMTAR